MKLRFGHLFWLLLALFCGTVIAEEEIRWAPDIGTARQASARFNVPLLIHFYGDHCVPCKNLEMRVFSKPKFVETLNRFFICVKVNGTQQPEIARDFAIHSWPTDVFVSPDGKLLYQGTCPKDLAGYLSILRNVAVMNRDRNVMLASQNNAPTNGAQPPIGQSAQYAVASQYPGPSTTFAPATQTAQSPSGMQSPETTGANLQTMPPQGVPGQVMPNQMVPAAGGQQGLIAQSNAVPTASSQTQMLQPAVTAPTPGQAVASTSGMQSQPMQAPMQLVSTQTNVMQAPAGASGSSLQQPAMPVTQSALAQPGFPAPTATQPSAQNHTPNPSGLPNPVVQQPSANAWGPRTSPPQSAGMLPQNQAAFAPAGGTPQTVVNRWNQPAIQSAPAQAAASNPQSSQHLQTMAAAGGVQHYDNSAPSLSQLQPSKAPSATVQSGPLTQVNQPTALVGAVQGAAQQVQLPAAPTSNAIGPGLPPLQKPAQVTSPASVHTGKIAFGNSDKALPSVESTIVSPESIPTVEIAKPAIQVANRTKAQLVSNPYFVDESASSDQSQPSGTTSETSGESQTSTPSEVVVAPAKPAEPAPLAMSGFCPVVLKNEGRWVEGSEDFAVQHRGGLYHCSSAEAQQAFMTNPDACAPLISGYDPLIFLEKGELVRGSIQHGLQQVDSGRFLFFESAENKQRYWAGFDRYNKALSVLVQLSRQQQ